jgi:hypothetical protein
MLKSPQAPAFLDVNALATNGYQQLEDDQKAVYKTNDRYSGQYRS